MIDEFENIFFWKKNTLSPMDRSSYQFKIIIWSVLHSRTSIYVNPYRHRVWGPIIINLSHIFRYQQPNTIVFRGMWFPSIFKIILEYFDISRPFDTMQFWIAQLGCPFINMNNSYILALARNAMVSNPYNFITFYYSHQKFDSFFASIYHY